jgi:hypothetical protein
LPKILDENHPRIPKATRGKAGAKMDRFHQRLTRFEIFSADRCAGLFRLTQSSRNIAG